jgi:hypothetical protein
MRFMALAALMAAAGSAQAELMVEQAQLASAARLNMATGQMSSFTPAGVTNRDAPAVLYSNLTAPSAVSGGFSQAGTAAIFGDRVNFAGMGGALDEFAFTVFNSTSGGNTVPMTSGTMNIEFRRGVDNSLIGGFSVNLAPFFGTGLNPGFYSIIDLTGLALATNISFDTTDVLIKQQLVGGQGRYGVILANPVAVGSSGGDMYINNPPALAEGFYNVGTAPNFIGNPGYFVFIPTPGAAAVLGMGGLVALRRRR